MTSFAEATAVKAIDPRTYSVFFHNTWAIGDVPHGGIVTSNVLAAVKLHFETILASQNQPHTIALHLDFIRKTTIGPAVITIQNTKLGRRTSTVHIALTQAASERGDSSATPSTCVVGYITQSNFAAETGISLSTNWALDPQPTPIDSIEALRRDDDPNWALQKLRPYAGFRKVGQHVNTYLPEKQVAQATVDEWICFSKAGERFTQESIGFVADLFPQIVESVYSAAEVQAGLDAELPAVNNAGDGFLASQKPLAHQRSQVASFWYPTVLLNLDVKKALPPEGVEFLFVRARAKQIRNGRVDLEVTILDNKGNLVALSTHVALVVSSARNLKKRTGDRSKI